MVVCADDGRFWHCWTSTTDDSNPDTSISNGVSNTRHRSKSAMPVAFRLMSSPSIGAITSLLVFVVRVSYTPKDLRTDLLRKVIRLLPCILPLSDFVAISAPCAHFGPTLPFFASLR